MTLRNILLGALALAMFAGVRPAKAEISPADFNKAMDAYLQNDKNLEKMLEAIKRYSIKLQAEEQKRQAQQEELSMEEQFKNPQKIDIGSAPVKGNDKAKITIVEFSDFQCPYCARGRAVMEELLKMYPQDVKVAFLHFPLPMHPAARGAAKASMAAHKQGKFWEMHDKLFLNQQDLSDEAYVRYAQELNLNLDKFKADMADPAADKVIDENMSLGSKLGVQGTPGFFVNGVQVKGARPAEYFKSLIERWKKQLP